MSETKRTNISTVPADIDDHARSVVECFESMILTGAFTNAEGYEAASALHGLICSALMAERRTRS